MADTAAGKKPRRKRKKKKPSIYVNLTNCKYDLLSRCVTAKGWKTCVDEDEITWNLYWSDLSVSAERVMFLDKVSSW